MSKRDELRKKIFSGSAAEPRYLVINGSEVEIKPPSIGEIMNYTKAIQDDPKAGIVTILLNNCYVPGTNEKVFEKTDEEVIMNMSVGPWMNELTQIVAELTGVKIDMEEVEGN